MKVTYVNGSCQPRKRYGLFAFLFDVILVVLTGGLWLIWIFCREMRNK